VRASGPSAPAQYLAALPASPPPVLLAIVCAEPIPVPPTAAADVNTQLDAILLVLEKQKKALRKTSESMDQCGTRLEETGAR